MALLSKAAEQQFGAGIWPDYGNDTAPMIINSNNICYQNGRAGPVPQSIPFFNGDRQIDAIWTQNVESTDQVFFVAAQEVRQVINNVIQGFSFFCSRRKPMFGTFGNFTLLADGGKLAVKRGASADTFERISGSPAKCDFVMVFSPFVLVFGDRTVSWCSIDNIDEWTINAGTQAGSLPIRDMDSDIIGVLRAFNGIVVFSETKMWIVNFLGFPNWFGVQKLDITVGTYSQQSMCLLDAFIYGVGPTGIWRTDGNSVDYIDRPQLREYFYARLGDPNDLLCLYDRANERVIIVFTNKENHRSSIVWDNRFQNWYPTGNDYSAVDNGNATRDTIFGDPRGRLLSQDQRVIAPGNNSSGDGIRFRARFAVRFSFGAQPFRGQFGRQTNTFEPTGISRALLLMRTGGTIIPGLGGNEDIFFETRDMDFGTTDEKYVDVVTFNVTRPGAGIFYFSYCIKDRMQEEEVWSEEFPQDPDLPFYLRETARYFRYKIRNSSATAAWQLTAINSYGEVVGGRM